MTTDQKTVNQISPFERFKDLANNLVKVPKSKIVELDKDERKKKKRSHKKTRKKETS